MIKLFRAFALGCLLAASTVATAEPITFQYTFSPISVKFNGTTRSTGNFTMAIHTDTTTPNHRFGFGDFVNGYAAEVYLTAADLGLNNTKVLGNTELYFGGSVVGFQIGANFNTIMTAVDGPQLQFGQYFNLATLVVPQAPISLGGTEFRTGALGIQLANGSYFDANQFTSFRGQNTLSVQAAGNEVPEPASMALAALGAAALLAARRRKA